MSSKFYNWETVFHVALKISSGEEEEEEEEEEDDEELNCFLYCIDLFSVFIIIIEKIKKTSGMDSRPTLL